MTRDPKIVSKNMSKIHSKDTVIEKIIRHFLALLISFLQNTKLLFSVIANFFMVKTGKY